MIIGRNFAEKLYSENQEEKLYSTGNEELDSLLEKAFCEGYELGQKEFAKKDKEAEDKEDEKKIKWSDRRAIKRYERLSKKKNGKEIIESHLKQVDEDPEIRSKELKSLHGKSLKRTGKIAAAVGIPYTALSAGIGYKFIGGKEGAKEGAKAALQGVAIGAGASEAGNQLAISLARRRSKKAGEEEKDSKRNKHYEKQRDIIKTATNKMTKEEFAKKYGK